MIKPSVNSLLISSLVLSCLYSGLPPLWATPRPNILFMMADDMGYGDVGAYNSDSKIPTPNMDRLAQEGMRFTDAHSPASACTPTRYGVLTGRYPWRSRLKSGVIEEFAKPLIEPNRITIASMLRDQNYATAAYGKWHLGVNVPKLDGNGFLRPDEGDSWTEGDWSAQISNGPIEYGFDHYFGKLGIRAHVIDDRYQGTPELKRCPGLHCVYQVPGWDTHQKETAWLDDAMAFMTAQHNKNQATDSDQPFFMYFASNQPHTPYVTPDHIHGVPVAGVSDAGPRGDEVVHFDVLLGHLLDKLDELDIAEQTLVIVTSDNGPLLQGELGNTDTFGHQSNGQWRGRKGHIWEGGHRVPFIARWGDGTDTGSMIKPGTISDQRIGLHDLMATAAELVGTELDDVSAEDSDSILSALIGTADEAPVRSPLIHQSSKGRLAIRDGDWKLIFDDFGLMIPRHLYNLSNDPGETDDRLEQEPWVVAYLQELMNQYLESGHSSNRFNFPEPVILGDLDLDADIDADDVVALHNWIGQPGPNELADMNRGLGSCCAEQYGDVDLADLDQLLAVLGTVVGDINPVDGVFDGTVDILDFGILSGNFGEMVSATYLDGNLNKDHVIDIEDFAILAGNFGHSAEHLPEPQTILLLAMTSLLLFRRRVN